MTQQKKHIPLLLLVVLQKLFHGVTLFGTEGTKSTLVVDEYDLRILKVDNHIGHMIAVHIDEAEGYWYKVGIVSIELGTDINAGVSSITAR